MDNNVTVPVKTSTIHNVGYENNIHCHAIAFYKDEEQKIDGKIPLV